MRTTVQGIVQATLALALFSCQAAPPGSSSSARIENPDLGLAIATLPEMFEVETNDTEAFQFRSIDGHASLWIEVGSEQTAGINLVEEVKKRRTSFQEAHDGHYFGNRELRTPHGVAFTARGAYSGEQGRVEETWVYTLHPAANRLLTLTYRYPSGSDSEQRVAELLEFLGEVEALNPPSEEGQT
jgi:hypothetical protein